MYDLYILQTCPYSIKVMDFLSKHNIEHHTHDISDPAELRELISLGGKDQVPFLYDKKNNIKMYESDDIINYLAGM